MTANRGNVADTCYVCETDEPLTGEQLETMMASTPYETPVATWKSTTAGILSLIVGYLNLLAGAFMVAGFPWTTVLGTTFAGLGIGWGLGLIALGALSVIGGICALTRSSWRMALVGSIAGLFPSLVMVPATLSLILVTLSRCEFEQY